MYDVTVHDKDSFIDEVCVVMETLHFWCHKAFELDRKYINIHWGRAEHKRLRYVSCRRILYHKVCK